jgi:hypothetical protein
MRQQCDLAVWSQDNNFSHNVGKTDDLIMDYRTRRTKHAPSHINRAVVDLGESFQIPRCPHH